MRPFGATVTPVGIEPSKEAICSSAPMGFSAGSVAGAGTARAAAGASDRSDAAYAYNANSAAGTEIVRTSALILGWERTIDCLLSGQPKLQQVSHAPR